MTDFPDYQEPAANAVALSTTNLTATGLAKESGGNLDTHTHLLAGTQAGALIAGAGRTVGQEVAALIASGSAAGAAGGTPLLHGHNQLFSVSGQVIAASGTYTPPDIVFTKPGYIVRITAQMSTTTAAMPSVHMAFNWRSSASGTLSLDSQDWYVPGGGSQARRTIIRGPVTGDTLHLVLTNGDINDTVTVNINVYETTHPPARHDGRGDNSFAYSGVTGINATAGALILASDTFSVGANTVITKSLPLYAGQVNVWINQNVAAGSTVQIFPTGDFDLANPEALATLDWTQPFTIPVAIPLSRAWVTMSFTNKAASAFAADVSVVALEYAS